MIIQTAPVKTSLGQNNVLFMLLGLGMATPCDIHGTLFVFKKEFLHV
jgi:hypothetical protein